MKDIIETVNSIPAILLIMTSYEGGGYVFACIYIQNLFGFEQDTSMFSDDQENGLRNQKIWLIAWIRDLSLRI